MVLLHGFKISAYILYLWLCRVCKRSPKIKDLYQPPKAFLCENLSTQSQRPNDDPKHFIGEEVFVLLPPEKQGLPDVPRVRIRRLKKKHPLSNCE